MKSYVQLLSVSLVLLVFGFSSGPQALAQAGEEASGVISRSADSSADDAIAERLNEIFSQIDDLQGVTVSVTSGVVELSGETMTNEASERAVRLANRVEGVVAVENQILRDVSVSTRVTPTFGALEAKLQSFVRGLPLLALALGVFLLILLVGWFVSRRDRLWQAMTPNRFVADLVSTGIFAAFFIIAVVTALTLLDATALLGTLLGAAGVFGLAIGFAVKDTIENYIASIMLSVRQPFRPNDHVLIDGNEGRVIRLTSRATVLMTLQGNHLRIPNSAVFKANILNYTRNPERRFDFGLGIDPEQEGLVAIEIGRDTLAELEFVLKDPPPAGIIDELGESTTNLIFNGWIDQTKTDFVKARSVAIATVKNALEAADFSLPDPSYRISVKGGGLLTTQQMDVEEVSSPKTDDQSKPAPSPASTSQESVAPDTSLERRVEEERQEEPNADLLSYEGKTE
tara:strand:+ start:1983 stop:3353 length:1371 start_codon:yes stop_codon:yes gene_type:complete